MHIPDAFCWTRFGVETGEPIDRIFERKERERQANGGVFLWGVGNSIRPSLLALNAQVDRPCVVFSPMLGRPDSRDITPSRAVVWTTAVGLTGHPCDLPPASVVTSSIRTDHPRPHHFALVCYAPTPIRPEPGAGSVRLHDLRNWARGTPIGVSQVTCVVTHSPSGDKGGPTYDIACVAELVPPYFVQLGDPTEVPANLRDNAGSIDVSTRFEQLLKLRDDHEPRRERQEALPLTR